MERLTKRSDFTGLILIDGRGYGEAYFGAKEDYERITKALNKLAAYEDAEEQGRMVVLPEPTPDIDFMRIFNLIMADAEDRVIVLPCKVGDNIYEIDLPEYGVIVCKVISVVFVTEVSVMVEVVEGHGIGSSYNFELADFGKTVFLSREEAEKALEGMKCT